jgi:hypothetical protein
MKKLIYIIILSSMINACSHQKNANDNKLLLPGKIIVRKTPDVNGSCYLYSNNVKTDFTLPKTSEKEYSGIRWMNRSDCFVGVENVQLQYKTIHSNLVLLDTLGNVIKNVINTQKGQYEGAPYLSPNDSLLFFITEVESKIQSGLDLFRRPVTINVINFKTQALVKQIPNVCDNIKFDIQESPWSSDGNSFVYSIVNDIKIQVVGETEPGELKTNSGVFVCDLNADTQRKIADKGRCAVWSPAGGVIAFIADNKIWLHNVVTGENELFYEAEKNEQLKVIHWAPDGKYLFVVCPKYFGSNFNMKHNEKLIEIIGKREVDFVKPNIGLNNFSWK